MPKKSISSAKSKQKIINPVTTSKPIKFSSEDLVSQANVALSNMQFELAVKFYKRALQMAPTDTSIMDALAEVQIQLGETHEAELMLQQSISLEPTRNPYKWCYLAQLQNGEQAFISYKKAAEIMSSTIATLTDEVELAVIRNQLARSYTSIGELFMTDLCFESDAEVQCESAIQQSLAVCPDNLDALQAYASFRLSQSRPIDACKLIETVYLMTKPLRDQANNRSVLEELSDETLPDDLPEPSFFITTAKLLIECTSVKPVLAEHAVELVHDLLSHDDDNIELWYLAGVAALSIQPPDLDAARYYLERAQSVLLALKEKSDEEGDEFAFEDQYGLVLDHLKILEDQETIERNGNINQMDQDEEWSVDDDNDEDYKDDDGEDGKDNDGNMD